MQLKPLELPRRRRSESESRRDTEIARARGIPTWKLRRERYLLATGRIDDLNREEGGAK